MKIVEVCPRYHPYIGGVETHVKEISERLVKKGFEIEVYTTDPSGTLPKEEIVNGIKVRRFRSFALHESYYFSPELYIGLKKIKYDILHSHSYHAFPLLISSLAREKRKKFFITLHFNKGGFSFFRSILHIPYTLFGHYIVNSADKIICVTEHEAELLKKKFPSCIKKLVIIPNGVSFDRFKNSKPILNGNEFKILYTGRISKEKGLKTLFYAYKELQEKIQNTKLIIVGNGPHLKELQVLSQKLYLKGVVWVGKISQDLMPCYYKSANVFVLPSIKELQGISTQEAMAAGLPVITTYHEGLKNIVYHKKTGMFFKKGDYRDLANKILTLSENENLCRNLGKNAQKHIKNNFDLNLLIQKYVKLFEEEYDRNE